MYGSSRISIDMQILNMATRYLLPFSYWWIYLLLFLCNVEKLFHFWVRIIYSSFVCRNGCINDPTTVQLLFEICQALHDGIDFVNSKGDDYQAARLISRFVLMVLNLTTYIRSSKIELFKFWQCYGYQFHLFEIHCLLFTVRLTMEQRWNDI